jgi:4'-phosphopantetheinyl transferase
MHRITAAEFVRANTPMALAWDEIHLWFFSPSAASKPDHMHTLRSLLAGYLDCDAATLRIERDVHGKPFVAAPSDQQIEFNLAHSADALTVALSLAQPLGVDIETTQRSRPWLDLAQRFFTPAECAALTALPGESLAAAFVQLWSCKEAVLKALGRGIAFGLERLDFSLDNEGRVTRLHAIAAEAGTPEQWRLAQLVPAPNLVGALAWRGPARIIRCFKSDY